MVHRAVDRWKEVAASTGTADFTLTGSAAAGFVTAASALAIGDTTWYCAQNGAEWEVGVGTLSASSTLSRTSIIASSAGGSKTAFTAPPLLFSTVPGGALAAFTTLIRSTAQSIPNNSYTALSFSGEIDSNLSMWSSGSPTRLTPPPWAKFTRLVATAIFSANANGPRAIRLQKNGAAIPYLATVSQAVSASGIETGVSITSRWIPVSPGDYFEVAVFQGSGSVLNIAAAATSLSGEVM